MAPDRRPVTRAPEAAWRLLGQLLQLRRAELGYRRRPAFTKDRDINIRLVTDIENAYRPNTFLNPTLRDVAQAYAVTWESLAGVLAGTAEKLEPAPPPSPVTQLPPVTGAQRRGSDYPYFTAIERRLRELAGQGITDPSGIQVFGPGRDAETWDGIGSRLDMDDRAWLIADLQRRADGRNGGARSDEV
jgi:hypothetical protein